VSHGTQVQEQIGDRSPADRIDESGRDLGERLEHESPLAEARMRNGQAGLVQHGIPEENQIEVERARRVRVRPLTASRLLGRQQRLEQRSRRHRRLADRGRIQEQRLRTGDADGNRVVVA